MDSLCLKGLTGALEVLFNSLELTQEGSILKIANIGPSFWQVQSINGTWGAHEKRDCPRASIRVKNPQRFCRGIVYTSRFLTGKRFGLGRTFSESLSWRASKLWGKTFLTLFSFSSPLLCSTTCCGYKENYRGVDHHGGAHIRKWR